MGFMDWAGTAAQTGLNTYKSLAELEMQKAAAQRAAEQQAMQQQLAQMQMQRATSEMERQKGYEGLMNDPSLYTTDESGNPILDERKFMKAAIKYMEPEKAYAAMRREPKSLTQMDLAQMAESGGPQAEYAKRVLERYSNSGKPPAGYVRGSEGQIILDPNSAGGLKQQEKLEQGRMMMQNTVDSFDMLESKIDELIDPKNKEDLRWATGRTGAALETGIGKMVGAGTGAYNMKAKLDSIKSQVGLDALAALKKASGAGLGSVTEAEHKLLQSYITSLDAAQSADAVISSAKQIKDFLGKTRSNLQTGLQNAEKRLKGATGENVNKQQSMNFIDEIWGKDAEIGKKIAQAESGLDAGAFNSAGGGKGAIGLFQIRGQLHEKALKEAGIINTIDDLRDPRTNAIAAKFLYDRDGTTPWNESKSVWGKGSGAQAGSTITLKSGKKIRVEG